MGVCDCEDHWSGDLCDIDVLALTAAITALSFDGDIRDKVDKSLPQQAETFEGGQLRGRVRRSLVCGWLGVSTQRHPVPMSVAMRDTRDKTRRGGE